MTLRRHSNDTIPPLDSSTHGCTGKATGGRRKKHLGDRAKRYGVEKETQERKVNTCGASEFSFLPPRSDSLPEQHRSKVSTQLDRMWCCSFGHGNSAPFPAARGTTAVTAAFAALCRVGITAKQSVQHPDSTPLRREEARQQ